MRLIILIYILIFTHLPTSSIAICSTEHYGRVDSVYTYIYKTPSQNDSMSNIYCYAENTYFVKILDKTNDYYKVYYNGVTGYVKCDYIKPTSSTPLHPYPNSVHIVTKDICNLRSSPSVDSSNILTTIPKNSSNILFLGRMTGEEAIDFGGTTWYYIEYDSYRGYIYSRYISSISGIHTNTEVVSYPESDNITPINPLSHGETIFYIVILSIPFFIILCILYIPPKRRAKKPKHKY